MFETIQSVEHAGDFHSVSHSSEQKPIERENKQLVIQWLKSITGSYPKNDR